MNKIGNVLATLKTRYDEDEEIMLYTLGGDRYLAKCSFNEPATATTVDGLAEKLSVRLPDDYRHMLLLHDGMKLFYTVRYGGAIEFFSIGDIQKNFLLLQDIYEGDSEEFQSCIPVGHYPDIGWIVLDMKRYEKDKRDYVRIFAIPHISVPGSFEDFIDRLIVAQGAAYWEWIY